MLGVHVLTVAEHLVVLHLGVILARLGGRCGDGVFAGDVGGERPAQASVLVAHRVDGGQRLAQRHVRFLVVGQWCADQLHQLGGQVVDGQIVDLARLVAAGNVVVGPDDVVGLPQALLMRSVVLAGKPLIVELGREERLVVAPEHHDHLAVEIAQGIEEVAQRLVGLLDARDVLVDIGECAVLDGLGVQIGRVDVQVHLLICRQQARIVARVVLHGHVKDELRVGVLVEQLKDFVVGCLVGHHAAQGVGSLEVVDRQELVKAKVLVDVLAVPVGCVVGVHGRCGISERLELLCQVSGRFHVVDGVGVHARAQVGHGVAGHKLKLGIGGAAAVGAHVELAAAEAVGQVLKVLRALVAGVHLLIDRKIREGLVHNGDDRGLLAIELLLGGGTGVACGGIGLVIGLGILFERCLGVVGGVVGGFGRLDGLCRTNKGRQITLAPVALERAPGVDGDAEGVVVVDKRDMRGHAAQAQHRHEQVGEQHALGVGGTLLTVRCYQAGVLA